MEHHEKPRVIDYEPRSDSTADDATAWRRRSKYMAIPTLVLGVVTFCLGYYAMIKGGLSPTYTAEDLLYMTGFSAGLTFLGLVCTLVMYMILGDRS